MHFQIIENSLIARIAAWKMRSSSLAITLGNRIYLTGISKELFIKDKLWLAHELVHVDQYRRLGFLHFLYSYIIEWIKNGYYNNKYEKEARTRAPEFLKYVESFL